MHYQRKSRPALWTQTPKAQAQITQRARDKVARRSERDKTTVRKPIRAVSRSRESLNREYQRERKKFLAVHFRCAVNPKLIATEIHHKRGRVGALLLAQEFWLPVSRESHNWIHANLQEAQNRGWIAKAGEWGKQP